jgi:hypothetical protein
MEGDAGGFLVDSTEECVQRVLFLLRDRDEARKRGQTGRERVRRRFLITRLLADEMRLLLSLASATTIPNSPPAAVQGTAAPAWV